MALGFSEMVLILVIAAFVFGPKKLPELARALGLAVREYRKAVNGVIETATQAASNVSETAPKELAKTLGVDIAGKDEKALAADIGKAADRYSRPEEQPKPPSQ